MPKSVESAPSTEAAELSNPFLQFVDPRRYRELVELANKRTEPGRLVCPLTRTGPSPTRGVVDHIERDALRRP